MTAKISNVALYVLLIAGVIVFLLGMVNEQYDPMLYYSYLLFGVSIVLAVLAAVFNMAIKPQTIKGTALSLVIFLAIFGLSYALADGSDYETFKVATTESVSRWAGAGLYMFYILLAGTVVSIVFSGIVKLIK